MHTFPVLILRRWIVGTALLIGLLLGAGTVTAEPERTEVPPAQVNINTADAAALAAGLSGIGMRRAEAIVAHRDAHGPFQDPYELTLIKGVGERIVARNESRIRLSD